MRLKQLCMFSFLAAMTAALVAQDRGCSCGSPTMRTSEGSVRPMMARGTEDSELNSLERLALDRSTTQRTTLSPTQYQEVIRASHEFAKSISGTDDAMYAKVSAKSLQAALKGFVANSYQG